LCQQNMVVKLTPLTSKKTQIAVPYDWPTVSVTDSEAIGLVENHQHVDLGCGRSAKVVTSGNRGCVCSNCTAADGAIIQGH
jgi:hypothetical protein